MTNFYKQRSIKESTYVTIICLQIKFTFPTREIAIGLMSEKCSTTIILIYKTTNKGLIIFAQISKVLKKEPNHWTTVYRTAFFHYILTNFLLYCVYLKIILLLFLFMWMMFSGTVKFKLQVNINQSYRLIEFKSIQPRILTQKTFKYFKNHPFRTLWILITSMMSVEHDDW